MIEIGTINLDEKEEVYLHSLLRTQALTSLGRI